MARLSQTASNLKHISNTVASALRAHRARLSAEIDSILYSSSPPTPLTIDAFIDALATYLEESTEEFAESATTVLREVAEDNAATDREIETREVLREELISQRNYLSGTYGEETADRFGYAGRTPTTTTRLVEVARTTEEKLRNHDFPTPLPGRTPIDRHQLADIITEMRADLEEAAEENIDEERETQAARSDRDKNRENWDLDYRGVANIAVGLFILARESDLADRVRPTHRRRQGVPEEEDLDDESGDIIVDDESTDDAPTDDTEEPVEA